jgi:hypothetical protein
VPQRGAPANWHKNMETFGRRGGTVGRPRHNESQITPVTSTDSINFFGFVQSAIVSGSAGYVVIAGTVNNAILGNSSCTVDEIVIITGSSTHNGAVSCEAFSGFTTPGTMVGFALSAQSTVGGTLSVLIDKR